MEAGQGSGEIWLFVFFFPTVFTRAGRRSWGYPADPHVSDGIGTPVWVCMVGAAGCCHEALHWGAAHSMGSLETAGQA